MRSCRLKSVYQNQKKFHHLLRKKIPAQLKHSIPGAAPAVKDLEDDSVAERGSSSIKSVLPVKEKDRKSAERPAAKKAIQLNTFMMEASII